MIPEILADTGNVSNSLLEVVINYRFDRRLLSDSIFDSFDVVFSFLLLYDGLDYFVFQFLTARLTTI